MIAIFRQILLAIAIFTPTAVWSVDGAETNIAQEQERQFLSVDYCADQYVIALAKRADILALSPAAESEYSYHALQAGPFKKVRPTIEEILIEDPDLVVRQWGGGYGARRFMQQLSMPIAQVAYGEDLATVRGNLTHIGQALKGHAMADELLDDMQARLEKLRQARAKIDKPLKAIYITPGGLTSGEGTFTDAILKEAGLENLMASLGHKGWVEMNLEALIETPPDMFVGAFFDLKSNHVNQWSVARHHLLRRMMTETLTILVPGRMVACSAWFSVDAMELIHEAAYGDVSGQEAMP